MGGARELLGVVGVMDNTVGAGCVERVATYLADEATGTKVLLACTERAVRLTPDQARHLARCLIRQAKLAEAGE